MDPNGLIDFITAAGKLKKLSRTGWVDYGVPDSESVADHSFRVALISLLLADLNGLDALKAVRMALIHDLAEAETGDLTPTQNYTDPEGFKHAEDAAMERLLEKLPGDIRGTYQAAWREFSGTLSDEARLVRDADKLEMVIQASEYQKEGGDKSRFMRFWHAEIKGDEARAIRDAVKAQASRSSSV